jgi:hypothetical protein
LPLKQLSQADVPETQVKHVELVHCVAMPPETEYPSEATVHNILLEVETTQAEHPGSHGTILLSTVAVLIPPPTD